MLRKTLTILSLIGLLLSVGLWAGVTEVLGMTEFIRNPSSAQNLNVTGCKVGQELAAGVEVGETNFNGFSSHRCY